ncbi:unnamed protein product, partial [Tetraodon nigroviridis]
DDVTQTEASQQLQLQHSDSSEKQQPKRLHVSNIPFRFRDPDLRQMFGQFGKILDVEIIFNERGSKGFGFVTFETSTDADRAREKLNGTIVEGRKIEVLSFLSFLPAFIYDASTCVREQRNSKSDDEQEGGQPLHQRLEAESCGGSRLRSGTLRRHRVPLPRHRSHGGLQGCPLARPRKGRVQHVPHGPPTAADPCLRSGRVPGWLLWCRDLRKYILAFWPGGYAAYRFAQPTTTAAFSDSYGRVYATADPYHHTIGPAATYSVGTMV